MYDMHYDLLTILYFNFLNGNKCANLKKCLKDIEGIYSKNNIRGGIINLYFMDEKEMEWQLGIPKNLLNNVPYMFKESIKILNRFKAEKEIPKNTNFLYSIEGCDYIKNESELEELYSLGLRSILLTWNTKNKYGSGLRSRRGLTLKGKRFIKKAIDLGIMIDLSHANPRTFNGIIKVIKKEQKKGKEVHVIASHSNCKSLCDRKRNLTDKQLIALKDVGGIIGLFSNSNFLSVNAENMNHEERMEKYIEHIKYAMELGFTTDKIVLSTDDMNFDPDSSFHNLETFELKNIKKETEKVLKKHFDEETVNKLMCENAIKLIKKLNKKKKK